MFRAAGTEVCGGAALPPVPGVPRINEVPRLIIDPLAVTRHLSSPTTNTGVRGRG